MTKLLDPELAIKNEIETAVKTQKIEEVTRQNVAEIQASLGADLEENIDATIDSNTDYKFLQTLSAPSSTTKELTSIIKEIWQTKLQEQKLQEQARKNELRAKIMMGGLVKKAGLDGLHPEKAEVLYGLLLEAKKRLESEPEILNQWNELGKDLVEVSKSYGREKMS